MKKVLSTTLAMLLILGVLTGCHKTPESPIVTRKNSDRMLETASGNEEEKESIAELLNVPERMILSVTNGKGDVSANADAEILLPDTDSVPTMRVRGRDFTQEEADRVLAYFIGDGEFNNRREAGYDLYEEGLIRALEELDNETDPVKRKGIQAGIDKLKSIVVETPDNVHEILPASRVFESTEDGISRIKGYSKNGRDHKYLSIVNWPAENKNMLLYTCEQKGYADIGHETGYETEAGKGNLGQLGLEASENIPLTLSPGDAKNKAREALAAMGIRDMEPYSCEEVWGGIRLNGGGDEEQLHHAYKLEFVRNIQGALLTYTENNIDRTVVQIDERTGERFASVWPYERISFVIDDTGIIEFLWESPYELTEQAVEHTRLMPFKDIQDIFSTMILVSNVQYGQYGTDMKITFNIDRVQLGLMRISEKNSPGTGLIVPVWDFFGPKIREYDDVKEQFTNNSSHLTINAIDGSIIDRNQGY